MYECIGPTFHINETKTYMIDSFDGVRAGLPGSVVVFRSTVQIIPDPFAHLPFLLGGKKQVVNLGMVNVTGYRGSVIPHRNN